MTRLAADFPRASEADWRSLVSRSAGRDAASLASTSEDGIATGPIYAPAAGSHLPLGRQGAWRIVQRIDCADAAAASADIRADRAGGVASFDVVFGTSPAAFAGGLALSAAGAVASTLAGQEAAVRIDAGERTAEIVSQIPGATALFDPIATLAAQGFLARPLEHHLASGDGTAVDGRVWHAGGATDAQELAAVLATLAAYLKRDAFAAVSVALAADADQFMTIAKFRAMRLLHARLREVAALPPAHLDLHAETAWRMMSRLDQHTNILRATMAVFAAGVGGADSIAALPFDAASRTGDPFARRIARNSQGILLAESGLGLVADPGGGAGAVEHLTHELARVAWDIFRGIEAEGGILAVLRSGSLQNAITAARDARMSAIREDRLKLTGVNAYPDKKAPPPGPAPRIGAPSRPGSPAETVEPLRFVRLSEPFEARS